MTMLSWNTEQQVQRFIDDKASISQVIQWCPATSVEHLVQHMKAEANNHWNIDPHVSFKLAEGIIALGQHYTNTSHIALGLMARGDARRHFDDLSNAWVDLVAAGQLFQSINEEVGWARTRIGLVYISVELNHADEAIADAAIAHEILVKHNEFELAAWLKINLGAVYNWLGDYSTALDCLAEALTYAHQVNPPNTSQLAAINLNTGYTHMVVGNFTQAEGFFSTASHLFLDTQYYVLATIDLNLAFIAKLRGQLRRAMQLAHQVIDRTEKVAMPLAAQARHTLALCYLQLNRYTEAYEQWSKVIEQFDSLNAGFEKAVALIGCAVAQAELGMVDEADQLFEGAKSTLQDIPDQLMAVIELKQAVLSLRQGKIDSALEQIDRVIAKSRSQQDIIDLSHGLAQRAEVLLEKSALQEALEAAWEALDLAAIDGMADVQYQSNVLLGKIYRQQDDYETALHHFHQAVNVIEQTQNQLTLTLRPAFLETKLDAFHQLIDCYLTSESIDEAFSVLETAKSQVWLRYLSSRDELTMKDCDQQTQDMLHQLNSLREVYRLDHQLIHDNTLDGSIPNNVRSEAKNRLAQTEQAIRTLTEKLHIFADASPTDSTSPMSIHTIQQQLDQDTLLIEFYSDQEQTWAFVIDHAGQSVYQLEISTSEIASHIASLQMNIYRTLNAGPQHRATVSLRNHFLRIAQPLYRALLQPVTEHLHNYQRIVFVPYGMLHYLPFHLLHDGQAFLAEQHEIALVPAAGLLTREPVKRSGGALILAHSRQGLLPATQTEAGIVQTYLKGQMFVEDEAVRARLANFPTKVLHIAAHGEFRIHDPNFSFLELADGPLLTDELMQHDLSYELITLSACETGRAHVVPGDELIGLGRACLYAGAGALIVSLWHAEDNYTHRLMSSLYHKLEQGHNKAKALQCAQLALLNENDSLHPAFWGAFQLIGDASPLS